MRILFLSQRVPYPPNRGDKIASAWIVRRLSRRHQVTCLAFAHEESDVKAAAALSAQGIPTLPVPLDRRWGPLRAVARLAGARPLTTAIYGSNALQREVDQRIQDVDLVFAFSSSMGAFAMKHTRVARVMHFVDLDSDKWRQYAEFTSPPMSWVYWREWRTLEAFERELAHTFDENVLSTDSEQTLFRERIPGPPSTVLRVGVDLEYFTPSPGGASDLVFTGVMDYLPNVDACEFFATEVLPLVRAGYAQATFTIVGSRPTRRIRRLAQKPGVTVTGYVDDTRVYLRRAAAFVAPLRIARGVQNKVLEAMAMGLPVVGTTASAQGIGAVSGEHYLVADDPEAQAAAVLSLLADRDRARALGANGRRWVEAHHNWETCLDGLQGILERAVGRRAARLSPSPR